MCQLFSQFLTTCIHHVQYSESLTGSLFLTSNNGLFMTLQNAITELFSQQNYNYCCLLTIGINAVAVFRNSQHSFKIFDSHSRDLHGMPHSFGTCTLLNVEGFENLIAYLQLSCLPTCTVPFEIWLQWEPVWFHSAKHTKYWTARSSWRHYDLSDDLGIPSTSFNSEPLMIMMIIVKWSKL